MSTGERPKLLFIAPLLPAAGGNGLAMRLGQFLAAYAKDFDIDLAVVPLAGGSAADDVFARRHASRLRQFTLAGPDSWFSLLARLQEPAARLAAFLAYGRPSITARLTVSVRRDVAAWCAGRDYRLVHIGRLYLLELAPQVSGPERPVSWVIDADEDDALACRQFAAIAARAGRYDEAAWLMAESAHFAALTARLLPQAAQVFAASRADANSLARHGAVSVIPNVASKPRRQHVLRQQRLLFVATLGYAPNAQAVAWFIKYCWPRLHKILPGWRFDVVGGGADATLQRLMRKPGIIWHGWQPDLTAFYARAGVVIVPVASGGGSRIKLLEAAAFGCPIVATHAGAAGSALLPKRDFLQADDPTRFIRAVRLCSQRPQRLGEAARQAAAQHHSADLWQTRIRMIASKHAL
ncbi:MAG: glycosyltransferase family 4 protein [Acidocella sp.]|nr:glycosyltransferase family 4 protein [Acidocella sp.]